MQVRTGDPEMAREINKALILNLLRMNDTIPRAEIARRLQLSKVTVSTIVNDLINSGIVIELGEGSSIERGGRPPILLSLNTSKHYVIGVDLGTTNMVAAIGDLKGNVHSKIRIPTSRDHRVETIIEQIACLIEEIVSNLDKRNKIAGVGMAVAGQVDKESGLIIFSPHFNWHNVQIAKMVGERTGFQIRADNCTRVMTIGEVWYGAGKNDSNILFINVGHGIGSALVIDRRIYRHHSEFGHVFITTKKIRCACGKYGCLEVVSSGEAIEREANRMLPGRDREWITAKMVAERALNGDSEAKKIYDEAGRYLGRGISILANTLNSEKVIIGGGVALSGDLLLEPIMREFEKNTMEGIREKISVSLSTLGMDAAVRGAIAMALDDIIYDHKLVNQL